MRRWLAVCATVGLTVVALTLFSADRPATIHGAPLAEPTPQLDSSERPTAEQERFRADLAAYLSELQEVAAAWEQDSYARAALQNSGRDLAAALTAAQEALPDLTADQLATLEEAFSLSPNWRQQPALLKSLTASTLAASGAAAAPSLPGIFGIPCPASPATGAAVAFYSKWVLKGLASGAYAILKNIPGSAEWTGVRAIAGVAWGLLEGGSMIAGTLLTELYECVKSEWSDERKSTWPTNASGDYVQGSSQESVDALDALIEQGQAALQTIGTTSDAIEADVDYLIGVLATVRGIVDTIEDTVTDINAKADTLITNLQEANDTANTINAKADTILSKLSAFEQLSVRMEIETDLSQEPSVLSPIGLFQLPQDQGGYLDLVRYIAADTVAKEEAAGQRIGNNARRYLADGDEAYQAGNYEEAYVSYAKAYRDATELAGSPNPGKK